MSVLDKSENNVVDDTLPLTCVIVGTETVQSHTVSLLNYQYIAYYGSLFD